MEPNFNTEFIEEAKREIDNLSQDANSEYLELAKKHLIPQGVEVPKPVAVFEMAGVPLFTQKSISTIIAKAKAGKTTVAAWVIVQVIKKGVNVLWIDTEQGLYYGSRTQFWVLRISGIETSEHLQFYDLKIHAPSERVKMIEALINLNRFNIIVIDGIRDLVLDINNPEQATLMATDLMRWAEKHDTHVINILHQNKGNEHARGHLGTELINKSESVIKITQDDLKQIIVEPEFTRGEPFTPFALARDEYGIPYLIEDWTMEEAGRGGKKEAITPINYERTVHFGIIEKVFSKSANLSKQRCKDNIRQYFELHGVKFGESKAREFLAHYLQEGFITENKNIKGYDKFEKVPLTQLKPVND